MFDFDLFQSFFCTVFGLLIDQTFEKTLVWICGFFFLVMTGVFLLRGIRKKKWNFSLKWFLVYILIFGFLQFECITNWPETTIQKDGKGPQYSLIELRCGEWLLMFYPSGLTLWRGQAAEYTGYSALFFCACLLVFFSIFLIGTLKYFFGKIFKNLFFGVALLGGAAMLFGTTNASYFSLVCLALFFAGLLMGTFAFWLAYLIFIFVEKLVFRRGL
jgi:hypothetical protein